MRRRRRGGRRLTAEEVVEVYNRAEYEARRASPEVRHYAVREALAEVGYTPLDVFRARYWIRQGKPDGYWWDDMGRKPRLRDG
jgi:hypothetical protein